MKTLRNYLAVPTGLSIMLTFALASAALGQSGGSKESETTRTPTVNAANPQTVNAQQSGAWSVGIDQANNKVRVSNSQDDPVPVKVVGSGPSRRPFQIIAGVDILGGGSGRTVLLPIPAGKRLVIENVSATTYRPPGIKMSIDFHTTFENGDGIDDIYDSALHGIALTEQGTVLDGSEVSSANHKVLVFADERLGTVNKIPIRVSFRLSGVITTGFARGSVSFSGYMEDLPVVP